MKKPITIFPTALLLQANNTNAQITYDNIVYPQKGIYFVKITDGEKQVVKKLVVE